MTVPTAALPVKPSAGECLHCTVPTNGSASCSFCTTCTPPDTVAQRLDAAVNRVDLIRADLNAELRQLPADAPLFAVTDVVVALGHLRRAAVALDRASDALEDDSKAVAR